MAHGASVATRGACCLSHALSSQLCGLSVAPVQLAPLAHRAGPHHGVSWSLAACSACDSYQSACEPSGITAASFENDQMEWHASYPPVSRVVAAIAPGWRLFSRFRCRCAPQLRPCHLGLCAVPAIRLVLHIALRQRRCTEGKFRVQASPAAAPPSFDAAVHPRSSAARLAGLTTAAAAGELRFCGGVLGLGSRAVHEGGDGAHACSRFSLQVLMMLTAAAQHRRYSPRELRRVFGMSRLLWIQGECLRRTQPCAWHAPWPFPPTGTLLLWVM